MDTYPAFSPVYQRKRCVHFNVYFERRSSSETGPSLRRSDMSGSKISDDNISKHLTLKLYPI